jgi:hypothetical protein
MFSVVGDAPIRHRISGILFHPFISWCEETTMKTTIALALITASIIGAASGYAAQDEKKQSATKAGEMQRGSMGMMDEKQMAQMQGRMKQMQEQMDRMHKTKDPKERQKLMQEHMQTMNEGMNMMRGMGGGMMMGMMGGKPGGMGQGMMGGNGMSGADPKQRQDMMEKRMDMMQMMMEQMMQHQQMMEPAPAK